MEVNSSTLRERIPSKKIIDPSVPDVLGKHANAQNMMLRNRNNVASAAGMPTARPQALGLGAKTASEPSIPVESGSTRESRASAEAIQPSCLSNMYWSCSV